MPTVRHKPPIARISRVIDQYISTEGRDLEYISLGFLAAFFEFKGRHRLAWKWLMGILQAVEFIEYRGTISKTSLLDYLGIEGTERKKPMPEQIAVFFSLDSSGRYTLTPAAQALRQDLTTSLRRVLLDDKERYRLLYDRWNAEEKAKRKQQKRFFHLPHEEQIRIARAFYAMPGNTPQERKAKQAARRYLYLNYDVRPLDLHGLAKANPIISAVRHAPPTPGDTTPADLDTLFRRPEQPTTDTDQPNTV